MAYVNEFRKGKELCLKNFESWIEEAEILENKGSWGHAYALRFAGIEALTQAYCCMLVEKKSWKPDSKDIKGVFNKTNNGHNKRLKILHDFILSENHILNILKNPRQFQLVLKNYTEKDRKKYLRIVSHELGKFRILIKKKRNDGIYVDYDESTYEFNSPFDLTKNDVTKLKNDIYVAINVMKMMIKNEPTIKIWKFLERIPNV